jgi:hypothetical protein
VRGWSRWAAVFSILPRIFFRLLRTHTRVNEEKELMVRIREK